MNEMSESLNICTQVLYRIANNKITLNNNNDNFFKKNIDLEFNKHNILEYILQYNKKLSYNSMEDLIIHFKD